MKNHKNWLREQHSSESYLKQQLRVKRKKEKNIDKDFNDFTNFSPTVADISDYLSFSLSLSV